MQRRGEPGDDSRVAPELDTAAFPDDVETLRALLAQRDALIAERDAALAERDADLLSARLEIEKLKVQLAALRRDRYGKSSERLTAGIGQLEIGLARGKWRARVELHGGFEGAWALIAQR